jgi:hypothetical protein
MRIAGSLCHLSGQVKIARTGYTDINFLQEHYVSLVMIDNLGDPVRPEEPVNTDSSVHIIRKNSKKHDFYLG